MKEENALELQKTRNHYDRYPYEVGVQNSSIYTSAKNPIGRFIAQVREGLVLDLGCGPGNLLPILGRRALFAVGFDISQRSLCRAAQAIGDLPVTLVQGNALNLPFPDWSFDCVIASGSLHHTPDAKAAFIEACRVLRPDGLVFISLYGAGSYYSFLYHTLGSLARGCERSWLAAWLVNRCFILPVFVLYFLIGRLLIHRKLVIPTYAEIMNYFADQILNPIVSFHRVSEISQWAESAGVKIVAVSYSHAGALINVEIRRPRALS